MTNTNQASTGPLPFTPSDENDPSTEENNPNDYSLFVAGEYPTGEDEEHHEQLWDEVGNLIDETEGDYYGYVQKSEISEENNETGSSVFPVVEQPLEESAPGAREGHNNIERPPQTSQLRIPIGMTEEVEQEFDRLNNRVSNLDQKHESLAYSIRDDLIKPSAKGLTLMLSAMTLVLAVYSSWVAIPTGILALLFFVGGWMIS